MKIEIDYQPSVKAVTVKNRVCRICGISFYYNSWFKNQGRPHIPDNHACDDCRHWQDMWQIRDDPTTVRVDNQHYIIGDGKGKTKGFSGVEWIIKFNDGRIVKTNDLWHQGRIPAIWVGIGLTNNAEFIG